MSASRRKKSPARALWAVAGAAALALGALASASYASDGPHGHGDHPGQHGLLTSLTSSPDCTLKVPADPLSAQGLMTPYVLESAGLACSERDENTAAFVQATILAPGGHLGVYDVTVENPGDSAVPPPVTVPRGSVVTIWTGFNANVLKLTGPGHLAFVNFAQQAYAGSPAFFAALGASGVTPPALGTASDGKVCPSSRDFSVVDQDQSDNNPQVYPAYGVFNGSDEKTLNSIDKVLGCSTWHVPSLSAPGTTASSGPLQEAQAARWQQPPVALVPGLDPFVARNGAPDLALQDLYRLQVGQPPALSGGDTPAYCAGLRDAGAPRLMLDAAAEALASSPFPAVAPTLAGFLKQRFEATWGNLRCAGPAPY